MSLKHNPYRSCTFLLLAACLLSHTVSSSDDKKDEKKPEKLKIVKLTQGMGLYATGPVSPDGKSILILGQKPESAPNLYIMNLADRSIRPPLTNFKWGVADPQWSPDGHFVAFAASQESATFSEVFVMELASGKSTRLTNNQFTDKEPVFSLDGKRVFFTSDESPLPDAAFGILHVASVPIKGGKPEFFTEDEVSTIHPGIAGDGKGVMLIKVDDQSGRHSIWLYSLEGKPLRDLTERKFARIHNFISLQGESKLVLWAQEGAEQQDGVYLLDLKTGAVEALPEPDLPKRNPVVSQDGKLIAFIAPTGAGTQLFLFDRQSGQVQQLTFKPANTYSPAFISNNEIIFGSDRDKSNELYLVDLTPPPPEEKKKK